jgi:predicted DNA-binding protein
MATMKPRITITLAEHRYELLRRLASARGVTMSSIVSDLVETVADSMERVCVVLEAAKRAPVEMDEGLRAALKHVTNEFEWHASKAIDQHDLFLSLAVESVDAADPRPVITGVRSPEQSGGKPSAARVSGDLRKKRGSDSRSIKGRA